MPILNKDGSTYTLKGPNPLLLDQARWEDGTVILHNLSWQPLTVKDPKQQPAPSPPPARPPDADPPAPPAPPGGSIKVHCLPAVVRVHTDELYDERHVTRSYGDKFLFDATTESRTDLSLVLWTPRKAVTPGSVLYPRTGHARWWRVAEAERAGSGFRLACVPSDEHPSFAD